MATTYDNRILEEVAAVEKEAENENSTIPLSSGVVLKQKPINVLRIQALVNRFKYPPVPELYDEKKDRLIRNPASPEYREMRQAVDIERTLAVIDATIVSGTEIVSVPEDVPALEDNGWVNELIVTHVIDNLPDEEHARYLAWVKYVAIRNQEDMLKVTAAAGLGMGVSEGRVAAALDTSFQDH